jgi:phage FluMu protein Com
MSIATITCSCGAKLFLPADATGREVRCPRCKAPITSGSESQVVARPSSPGKTASVCPICQSAIDESDIEVLCPKCDQVHHQECWLEIGGCSTYGCPEAPAIAKEPTAADRPLTAWGDTKKCPACGETIKSIALRCRYCKTSFDTVDPLTVADLRRGVHKTESLKTTSTHIITLFIFSAIGVLAPLMLLISLAVVLPRRRILTKAGPFYLVLGYSSIGLSAVYSILMLVFLVFKL